MAIPPAPDIDDVALRREIIAGLERTIWQPSPGVSEFDRVEAVQLLGRFRDGAAEVALVRVLGEGTMRIQPRPLGRWLRDTALDTLLRSPSQSPANVDRALARYYNFGSRLRRGRLERAVIYDDIPVLVRAGRLGLLLRVYVLPLLGLLVAWMLVAEGLAAVANALSPPDQLQDVLGTRIAPLIFFTGLGLLLFNLHQIVVVLLVAALGPRLPLPQLHRPWFKAALGVVLAVLAAGLSLFAYRLVRALDFGYTDASAQAVSNILLVLPLLALPCYMVAHDLELAVRERRQGMASAGWSTLAVVLRWAGALVYIAFGVVAFGLTDRQLTLFALTPPSDLDDLIAMWPYLVYLFAAPIPVLLLLGLVGGLGRLLRRPRVAGAR